MISSTPNSPGWRLALGAVAAITWRPFKGRLTLLPEISGYTIDGEGIPHLSLATQWNLGR